MDSLCLLVVLLFCMHSWSPQTCSGKENRPALYQQLYCLTAAAHVRAHESDHYEGNALCALFFCQPMKCGHFQTCCTGRVSEDVLKDVDGTFICYADSLYTVSVLQLMPKMLPRAA